MTKKLNSAQVALRKRASPRLALAYLKFFKTGPGEYGEGDQFIGIPVREQRALMKQFPAPSDQDLSMLIKSPIHEDRLFGLMCLVRKYEKEKDLALKGKIFNFYMRHRKGVNNWDLVDVSAHKILGDYCFRIGNASELKKLAQSKRHWDRRMAMLGTYGYIRQNELDLTFQFAEKFLGEKEDLMHKVTGWMLREAGKRDLPRLRKFIAKHGPKIPRTMLRYAIEKMTPTERKRILASTRQ